MDDILKPFGVLVAGIVGALGLYVVAFELIDLQHLLEIVSALLGYGLVGALAALGLLYVYSKR